MPRPARWAPIWWATTAVMAPGEHAFTLVVTDRVTQWTELRAVLNKVQKWVFQALLWTRAVVSAGNRARRGALRHDNSRGRIKVSVRRCGSRLSLSCAPVGIPADDDMTSCRDGPQPGYHDRNGGAEGGVDDSSEHGGLLPGNVAATDGPGWHDSQQRSRWRPLGSGSL